MEYYCFKMDMLLIDIQYSLLPKSQNGFKNKEKMSSNCITNLHKTVLEKLSCSYLTSSVRVLVFLGFFFSWIDHHEPV